MFLWFHDRDIKKRGIRIFSDSKVFGGGLIGKIIQVGHSEECRALWYFYTDADSAYIWLAGDILDLFIPARKVGVWAIEIW